MTFEEHDLWMKQLWAFIAIIKDKKPRDLSCLFFITEEVIESRKWGKEIPYINWPKEWAVKSIPSHAALLDFNIRLISNIEKWVSIYLDGYDNLGYYGSPYWEVYCPVRSDCWRFDMEDIDGVFAQINEIFTYEGPVQITRPFVLNENKEVKGIKENDV